MNGKFSTALAAVGLLSGVSAWAGPIEVSGRAPQQALHALIGAERVNPGASLSVTLLNGRPGYPAFTLILRSNGLTLATRVVEAPDDGRVQVVLTNATKRLANELVISAERGRPLSRATAAHTTQPAVRPSRSSPVRREP